MSSKRIRAFTALRDRLLVIQKPAFATDAGKKVYPIGQIPQSGPADPETAIAIIVGDSTEEHQGFSGVIVGRVTVSVQAFARLAQPEMADPFLVAEAIVADIKRAVEKDRSLEGNCSEPGFNRASVRAARRVEGSEYVGAAVDYALTFEEKWGEA
jgi:hypothetical protein